jgi:hypothetical protein
MKIISIFIVLSESVFSLVSKKRWSSENLFNETIDQTNISYADQTNSFYGDQTNRSYGESIAEIKVLPPNDPPSTNQTINWSNASLDFQLSNETTTLGAEEGPNNGIYAFIILPILLLALAAILVHHHRKRGTAIENL